MSIYFIYWWAARIAYVILVSTLAASMAMNMGLKAMFAIDIRRSGG